MDASGQGRMINLLCCVIGRGAYGGEDRATSESDPLLRAPTRTGRSHHFNLNFIWYSVAPVRTSARKRHFER